MPPPAAEFFSKIPQRARILVLDLGFLGDTIHLIPALAAIRRALPEVRLEVMVAEHIQGILAVCPWIDAVHGYPRFPKGPRWYQDFGRVRSLRAQKYDVVINLNGSDRSSLLSRLTGAPLRLGRVPPKTSWFWPWCFTHAVAVPHGTKPVMLQRLDALVAAGFPRPANFKMFPIETPVSVKQRVAQKLGEKRPFVHVSPFATMNEKELAVEKLADFLNRAQSARPELALVLSIAPNDREKNKLKVLLPHLHNQPWRVFPGNLDLVELAEVIGQSRIHLGGDSGALHVALMTDTPTLSWWRDYPGRVEWQPQGPQHSAVIAASDSPGYLEVDGAELLRLFLVAVSQAAPNRV